MESTGGGITLSDKGENSTVYIQSNASRSEGAVSVKCIGDILLEADIEGSIIYSDGAVDVESTGGSITLSAGSDQYGTVYIISGEDKVSVKSPGDVLLQLTNPLAEHGEVWIGAGVALASVESTGGSITLSNKGSGNSKVCINSYNQVHVVAAEDVKMTNSYINGADVVIVTDTSHPTPLSNPPAGVGNLNMDSASSVRTPSNTGEVRIYAGFDENNRADISDAALINGSAYSTMKGALDTQDANNYFNVWYNVTPEPGYAGPATFYYKDILSSVPIEEGNVESAREIASSAILSSVISSYQGDTLLDFIRRSYITNSRAFHHQYRHAKAPNSKDEKKRGSSQSKDGRGRHSTRTYRTKK